MVGKIVAKSEIVKVYRRRMETVSKGHGTFYNEVAGAI